MKSKNYFLKKKTNPNSKRRKQTITRKEEQDLIRNEAKQTKIVSKDTNSDSER